MVTRGVEMCDLDDVNTRSLPGFGCESFAGVSCTGFMDEDCLWDLSLGHTGDGKFDGETFWVGCGWFFWSGRGGGREDVRTRQQGRFSLDDARF
jgi:hypothetical protein